MSLSSIPRPKPRALVVDDDDMVSRSLRLVLGALGFEADTAGDANEALRVLAKDDRWDVLITDLLMPDVPGTILARQVRRMMPKIWIIACSGHLDDSIDLKATGIDIALMKPISVDALMDALQRRPQ